MTKNMGKRICRTAGILSALFLFTEPGSPAALAGGSIHRVRVRLEVEKFDEGGNPVLNAWTDSSSYEMLETEVSQEEKNQYEICLTAEEGNVFSVMEQEDIRFSGEKAVCTKAVRSDGGQTLTLMFHLEEPGEITGTIGRAWIEGTMGRWEAAPHTQTYLVMLYRNGKRTGLPHRTAGLSYDFLPLMQEEGNYYFKVFPLTEKGKKGEGTESGRIQIDGSTAVGNQDRWEKQWVCAAGLGEWTEEETNIFLETVRETVGWFPDGEKNYYIEKDGCLPQENWICEDNRWYYFDSRGQVKKNCWQEWKSAWYWLGSDGCMEREVKEEENSEEIADDNSGQNRSHK